MLNPFVKVIAGLLALVAIAVPSIRVLLPGILEQDPPTPEARVRIAVHTPDQARDLSVNVVQFISRTGKLRFFVQLFSDVNPASDYDISILVFPSEGSYLPEMTCKNGNSKYGGIDVQRHTHANDVQQDSLRELAHLVFEDSSRPMYELSTRSTAMPASDPINPRSFAADPKYDLNCVLAPGATVDTTGTYFPTGDRAANADQKMLNFARVMWLRHAATETSYPIYDDPQPTDGTIWVRSAFERDPAYFMLDSSSQFEYVQENWIYDEQPMQMGSDVPTCRRDLCWGRDVWAYLQKTNYDRVKNMKSFLLGIATSLIITIIGFSVKSGIEHIKIRRAVPNPPWP